MAELTYTYTTLPKIWPGKKRASFFRRERGPFKVTTWRPIEVLLLRELSKLGAKNVRIAVDMPHPQSWNMQGTPRAGARAATPAVIVSFTRRDGAQLMFPCDTFNDWQTNIYAIAKSLELLRAIDRYQVMPEGRDQYTGAQLQITSGATAMSPDDAAALIGALSELPPHVILQEPSVAAMAIRIARRQSHPDTEGGSEEAYVRVTNAMAVLNAVHGGSDACISRSACSCAPAASRR